MAKFSSEEDRKVTKDAHSGGGGNILKLEEGHNFVVFLDSEYEQGFIHWVKSGGQNFRRTCVGGIQSKGWNPEECELCALALEMYEMKKEALSDGDKRLSKDYNDRGNDIKSNYQAIVPAIMGSVIVERKKNKKTGEMEKIYVPDFEEFEIGKLALTHPQINKLLDRVEKLNLDEDEVPEYMTTHVIDFIKKKEGDKKYAEVKKVRISKKSFDVESLEIDEDDILDVSGEFEESDDLEKIADLYRSELEEEDEEEYEEEELDKKKSKKSSSKSKKKSLGRKVRKASKEEDEEEDEEEFTSEDYEETDDEEEDVPF